jgi:RNA polymerase sigma factor (sigma-70 family)
MRGTRARDGTDEEHNRVKLMDNSPLDALLEKLCSGDAAAAALAFVTYEPYLRMVVRRHLSAKLRAKFDSMDIVQSAWADVLKGFRSGRWQFADAAHLRAFLIKVTRNRFLNRLRQQRRALEHERAVPDTTLCEMSSTVEERPSSVAEAEDLWEELLSLCHPSHRELLHLRRLGLPLAEVASRTGLHKSSVRRILYDLARRWVERRQTEETVPKIPARV